MQDWYYNELRHCGVNYADTAQAEIYEERHAQFRDFKAEYQHMREFLSLEDSKNLTMIDLGCGTGVLEQYAAKDFRKIYAVDISDVMLEQAKKKLAAQNIENVELVQAGFLSYRHQGSPVDIVVTKAAFHHLPDFWKQIALLNMNQMIKLGGMLYIFDVVFNFRPENYRERIGDWVSGFEQRVGEQFSKEVKTHIRDEYSTFGWILEGMLEQAGFKVEKAQSTDGFMTEYLCRKKNTLITNQV